MGTNSLNTHAVFGDTDRAGGVPDGHAFGDTDRAGGVPDGHAPSGHAPSGHAFGGHAPSGHAPSGHAPSGHALNSVRRVSCDRPGEGADADPAGPAPGGADCASDCRDICLCAAPIGLVADGGPVYLEGRLVISLSFQGSSVDGVVNLDAGELLERFRLWDDLAETWYADDLEVMRFEQVDVVARHSSLGAAAVSAGPEPGILWLGAMNLQARIVPVPDLDDVGMKENQAFDLRWKRL